MADSSEEQLAAMLADEQRDFRRILFAGVGTLLVLVLVSVVLSFYYFFASQQLAQTSRALERQAFETRRTVEAQNSRIAAQSNALRIAFNEIRAAGAAAGPLRPAQVQAALGAARNYLQRGRRLSLANERLLRQIAAAPRAPVSPGTKALFTGVIALIESGQLGEAIAENSEGLPPRLEAAKTAFERAAAERAIAPLANAGLASILNSEAASPRSSFSLASCNQVFAAVEASAERGAPGPLPIFWRGQCERKLGRAAVSLPDYARSLEAAAPNIAGENADEDELTLAYNGFHGVGTTLIALGHSAASDANLRQGLEIARRLCHPDGDAAAGTEEMRLALACLARAIEIRRRLRQTEFDIDGTQENVSFAYLRDDRFAEAFANASAVERSGLFAWNELVIALTARRVRFTDAAQQRAAVEAGSLATRRVALFSVGAFNTCELKRLLNDDLFAAATRIALATHHDANRDEVNCASPAAAG